MKGVEKNNEKNHRAKILVYFLLSSIMPQYKKQKIFDDYRDQALKMLGMDFSEIMDN